MERKWVNKYKRKLSQEGLGLNSLPDSANSAAEPGQGVRFPSPWSPPPQRPRAWAGRSGDQCENAPRFPWSWNGGGPVGKATTPWGTRGTWVWPLCPWEEAKGEDILGFPASSSPASCSWTFYGAYSSVHRRETLWVVTGQDASSRPCLPLLGSKARTVQTEVETPVERERTLEHSGRTQEALQGQAASLGSALS